MKLNTQGLKVKSGMTLLELTVVILVLLSLISILFVGARAWKKGSDRSANILNIRNVQQAVRGYQNTNEKAATDTIATSVLFDTTTGYMKEPKPPIAGVTYSYNSTFAEPGTIFISNPDLGKTAGGGEYWYSSAEITAGKTAGW